jgi:prevent-host-death family protein
MGMSTKTVSVSDLRSNLADSLESVGDDDILIVTRRGKKERAIIDLDKLEDLLAASDPGYLATIKEARDSKEYFSHDEVFGNL